MANLSAGRRLTAMTTLVVGLAVVLGVVSSIVTHRLGTALETALAEAIPRQAAAARLSLRLSEYDAACRALGAAILRRQPAEAARVAGAAETEVRRAIDTMRTADREADLTAMTGAFDQAARQAQQAGSAAAAADAAAAETAYQGFEQQVLSPLGGLREQGRQLIEREARQIDTVREESGGGGTTGFVIVVALGIGSIVVGLGVMGSVRGIQSAVRETVTELKENARRLAATANQVSASSQSVSRAASEQAASLEETSASTEEIHSMTKRNAENAETASNKTNEASRTIQETNQALEEMVASMNQIMTSSNEISKIIKVIDDIAFQTNILALNAAVEAARAGDAGMGFAVVADEVRSLAQRSAQAARDTTQLIEESINRASEGKEKLDQVTRAITVLTDSSLEAKALVEQVYAGSQEQARGIAQISRAVLQMEQLTQQLAATAEQSAASGQGLTSQAHRVDEVVAGLQRAVGHGEEGRREPAGAVAGNHAGLAGRFQAPARVAAPASARPVPAKAAAAVKSPAGKPKGPAPKAASKPAAKPALKPAPVKTAPRPAPASTADGLRALQSATGASTAPRGGAKPTVRDGYTDHFAAPAPMNGADNSKLDPESILPLNDDDFKPF